MREGFINDFLVGAATLIEKGNPVFAKEATGYAFQPTAGNNAAAGDKYLGICVETVDNSTGAAGAVSVRVFLKGIHQVPNTATLTQASVGDPVKVTAAGALATGTAAYNIGYVMAVTTALVDIRIDNAIGLAYA